MSLPFKFPRVAMILASTLLFSTLASPQPDTQRPAAAPNRSGAGAKERNTTATKLAVVIAIDGLNYDRLRQYDRWYVSGLRRLLDQGRDFANTNYRHMNTETGPGHSSLSTGAPPRVTGIVANDWHELSPDGSKLVLVNCVESASGESGPGKLKVATLGDRLVEARPGARVLAVAGKARAALLMAGHDPRHAAYWYDRRSGLFVTSKTYDPAAPGPQRANGLVKAYNTERGGNMLPGRLGLLWKPLPMLLDADGLPRVLPTPTPKLRDFQLTALGVGFDHDLGRHPKGYFDGVYNSPYVDELVADLAVEFIRDETLQLGRGPAPDLLMLSFSAQDTVSHGAGPESEENLDVLRRLDRQLGRVFAALDQALPSSSIALGFSSDHGFTPLPEAWRRDHPASTSGRLVDDHERTFPSAVQRLNRVLRDELCLPESLASIIGFDGWSVVYNRASFPTRSVAGSCGAAGRELTLADLDAALPRVALRHFGEELSAVKLVSQRAEWPADKEVGEFLENNYYPGRSGDAYLIPKPYVITHWDPARGSNHGSHHEYDTHVPLIFWGGAFAPGVVAGPAAPYDLAPTLGDLLGVKLPEAVGHSRLR